MTRPDGQHLAFLLSLGALPLAACLPSDDDDNDDDAGTTPSTMTNTNVTTEGTATDDPTAATDPGSATATGTGGTDTSDPTEADTTAGTFECGDVPEPELCEPYVAHLTKCVGGGYYSLEYCACAIAYASMYGGEPCVTAYEEYYACIIAADCEQITADTACEAEATALDTTCAFGGTGG